MARIESISIGGYYPTPATMVPLLASLFQVEPGLDYAYFDPCAGDGEAVMSFIRTIHAVSEVPEGKCNLLPKVNLFTIEMETTRYDALKARAEQHSWNWGKNTLCADAFRVTFTQTTGVGLLYLNPPYDTDPICGRLEEKFLARFTPTLKAGGWLVFLVPFYALAASADTLGKEYDQVSCFRFPEPEFSGYKQVALIARKREAALFEPAPKIVAQVQGWAKDSASIKVLTEFAETFKIPKGGYGNPFEWKAKPIDFTRLLETVLPWGITDRGGKAHRIQGLLPEGTLEDLLVRRYPVAMPPRSAHIAAGIAAGIFNGSRIMPDKAESTLPPILVKGVFDKEFRTVEEKLDKEGNVKGLLQVQQPKLVTTVLDLRSNVFVTIRPSADVTGTQELGAMTMADLLAEYGQGLMQVMLKQCPVLHDPSRPEDHIPLAPLARKLFPAQAHATQAAIKLLGGLNASKQSRQFKSAFVLGEIGSGKTTVALAAMETIKAKRTLVLCPPHLLQSWTDQNAAVTPWVRAVVLSDIQDLQKLVNDTDDRPVLAILSREVAKLGHSHSSVSGLCPACGSALEATDFAKKRETCSARKLFAKDDSGKAMMKLALSLAQVFPQDHRVSQLLRTRPLQALIQRLCTKSEDKAPKAFNQAAWLKALAGFDALIDVLLKDTREKAWPAVLALLAANPEPSRVLRVTRAVIEQGHLDQARQALLFVDNTPEVLEIIAQMKEAEKDSRSYFSDTTWASWEKKRTYYRGKLGDKVFDWATQDFDLDDKKLRTWKEHVLGDPAIAVEAISLLGNDLYRWGSECGEPLFQAIPEPRRFPLATFIARRLPKFFDLLVLDECHEYATDGSAQERSAHRLTALGMPTLGLTGTIMNGYAESMFTNMWAFSADFRREFERDERARFVDRYGYRKRLVEDHDKKTGEVLEYGSVTDRVERTERNVGHAPGVLPLFLLRYMLPQAVTLHKTDLGIDIPNCTEQVETVIPTGELLQRYRGLERALVNQIREDRFTDLSGKLWGAMANLPSYLDLATEDTGNRDGRYSIRYPDSVGGGIVAEAEPFPLDVILPKEAMMLDQVQTSLDEGRNVMVFGWHTSLLPRLSRLLEKRLKTKCPILEPSKVPTKKRQAWIDEMVVRKKRRVLVVNPVAIQTGLNNLVYFSDEFWMENPMCNPTIYRQAVGRVDRIGQELLTRIFFLLYEGTSQQALHSLLMQKVAVSMSTDGLDAESALQAAGIGVDSAFSSFAVGRQLYEMLMSNQTMGKVIVPKKRAPAIVKVPRALTEEEAFQYAMQLGE